jgi:hypothetical protein
MLLNRRGDVAQMIPRPRLRDPPGERLFGDAKQPLLLFRNSTDGEGRSAIPVEAVLQHPHIDGDDLTILQ